MRPFGDGPGNEAIRPGFFFFLFPVIIIVVPGA